METKDRIIQEALKLFAAKGYDGVSMRQIAAAVGIQAASLYSHYAGKESIFNAIIALSQERYAQTMQRLGFGPGPSPDPRSMLGLKEKDLQRISRELFLYLLKDETAAPLRRMLSSEQSRDSIAGKTYQSLYVDEVLESQTRVFEALIAAGEIRKGDPAVTALHFYAPFLLLLNRYDRKPEREAEALAAVEAHVSQFLRRYGKKAK